MTIINPCFLPKPTKFQLKLMAMPAGSMCGAIERVPDVTCRALSGLVELWRAMSRLVGVCRDRPNSTRHHRSDAVAIARSEWIKIGYTILKRFQHVERVADEIEITFRHAVRVEDRRVGIET